MLHFFYFVLYLTDTVEFPAYLALLLFPLFHLHVPALSPLNINTSKSLAPLECDENANSHEITRANTQDYLWNVREITMRSIRKRAF